MVKVSKLTYQLTFSPPNTVSAFAKDSIRLELQAEMFYEETANNPGTQALYIQKNKNEFSFEKSMPKQVDQA